MAVRGGFWVLVLLTVLGGCADKASTPVMFAPLAYGYLRPLRVTVGAVEVVDRRVDVSGRDVSGQSPAVPADALQQMAQDRLMAAGSSGRAVFTIEQASITADGPTLDGLFKVRLDIYTSDGKQAAFAEAAVARSVGAPDGEDALRPALYGLTRQMMSDMNVEFEFQMRRALGDWMQSGDGPAPPPPPVQQQPLPPPV